MFEITEKFTSEQNRNIHYNKHVKRNKEFGKITEQEYEELANQLQTSKIDNKNVFGYISETREGKTAYCKYDKETGIFVVYTYRNNTSYTITCYIKSWREYNADKAIEYHDEIPQGL